MLVHFKKWATSLIFFTLSFSSQKLCFEIDKLEALDVVQPFALDKLTYSANINFDKKEFGYLVDLKPDSYVGTDLLKNSCFYLKQKNKFKKICLTISSSSKSPVHKNLHFDLYGCWTFNCLTVQGILVGKDAVTHIYRLEHGDPFDLEKHTHSVKDIKKHFYDNGFFDCKIKEVFESDVKTKSVKVALNLNKGNKFFINNCIFKFYEEGRSLTDKFKSKVSELYAQRFCRSYSKAKTNKIKEQLKKYLHNNGYALSEILIEESVDNKEQTVSLSVKIYLNKRVESFFKGNRTFSSKLLNEHLISLSHSSFNLPLVLLEEELLKFYKSRGFWNVQVTGQETKCGYIFDIVEGNRTNIGKVVVSGLTSYKREKITAFFKKLVDKGYSEEEIQSCVEKLTQFYLKKGFLDFNCSTQLEYIEERGCYKLCVNIQEGSKYILGSVRVIGYNSLEKLLLFRSDLSKTFSTEVLAFQRKFIGEYLSQYGLKAVVSDPEITYKISGNKKLVTVSWNINKVEQQDVFGKAIIFGSTNYSSSKLLRELAFKPGQIWDREKLNESFLSLRKLNSFDSVRIYPHAENDPLGRRPIFIKLYPSNKYEFKTRIGFQQVSKNLTFRGRGTYKLGASFEIKSPFLLGDQINLETDFTRFYRKVVASYKMPWLKNFPVRTILQGYNNKYQQPVYIGSKKNLYEVRQKGFLTSFENKKKNVSSALSFGFERMRISKLKKNIAEAIRFSDQFIDKSIPYIFVEPSLFIDYLDDKINPTRGFYSLLTGKGMVSNCHSLDFAKFIWEHAFFMPIFRPIVFATRVRFGHVFIKDFTNLVPSERFYLGGSNSLRGYFPDFAPPLGSYKNDEDRVEYSPIGGNSLWNVNFELRLPVYRNVSLVFFNDLGGLSNPQDKMNLLYAVGTGIRYFTPVGPLRLDFAWRPQASKQNSQLMWFLTLGHAF